MIRDTLPDAAARAVFLAGNEEVMWAGSSLNQVNSIPSGRYQWVKRTYQRDERKDTIYGRWG